MKPTPGLGCSRTHLSEVRPELGMAEQPRGQHPQPLHCVWLTGWHWGQWAHSSWAATQWQRHKHPRLLPSVFILILEAAVHGVYQKTKQTTIQWFGQEITVECSHLCGMPTYYHVSWKRRRRGGIRTSGPLILEANTTMGLVHSLWHPHTSDNVKNDPESTYQLLHMMPSHECQVPWLTRTSDHAVAPLHSWAISSQIES